MIDTQDQYPDTVVAVGAVEHGADDRHGAEGGQGRQVQGRGLRPVFDDEVQGLASWRRSARFEKKIPADLIAKVKAKEKAILDGSFKVAVDDTEPKSTAK